MRQSVAFRIIMSNLEKNIQRKTYSGEKWLSTDGLELLGALAWAGGAVSRACQDGWLAMLPRGGGHGVRVQLEIRDVSGYSGQRIFCIFELSHAENIEDQSKCQKTLWWDDGLNPVISTHGFPIRISGA